jgi:hypothetical protein
VLEEARHAGARLGDTPQAIEPHGVDGFTHRQVAHVWGLVGGVVEAVAHAECFKHASHTPQLIADLRAVRVRLGWEIKTV